MVGGAGHRDSFGGMLDERVSARGCVFEEEYARVCACASVFECSYFYMSECSFITK